MVDQIGQPVRPAFSEQLLKEAPTKPQRLDTNATRPAQTAVAAEPAKTDRAAPGHQQQPQERTAAIQLEAESDRAEQQPAENHRTDEEADRGFTGQEGQLDGLLVSAGERQDFEVGAGGEGEEVARAVYGSQADRLGFGKGELGAHRKELGVGGKAQV
jgi:hypothetical protein